MTTETKTPKGIIQGKIVNVGYKPYQSPNDPLPSNDKPSFFVDIQDDKGFTQSYHGKMLKDELERLNVLKDDVLQDNPYVSIADYGYQNINIGDEIVKKRLWEIEVIEPVQEQVQEQEQDLDNSIERDESRELTHEPKAELPFHTHSQLTPDEKVKAISEFAQDKVIVKGKNIRQMRIDDILNDVPDNIKEKYNVKIKNFSLGHETLQFKPYGKDSVDFELKSNGKMQTKKNDRETINSMLDVAQAQGWGAVKIKGSKEFKSQMFIEASLRGLEVKGYNPSREDLLNLQMRRDLQRNEAEKAGEKITLESDIKTIFAEKMAQQPQPQGIIDKTKALFTQDMTFDDFQAKIVDYKNQYTEKLQGADFADVENFRKETQSLPSISDKDVTIDNTADIIARIQLESELIETGKWQELKDQYIAEQTQANEIENEPLDIDVEQPSQEQEPLEPEKTETELQPQEQETGEQVQEQDEQQQEQTTPSQSEPQHEQVEQELPKEQEQPQAEQEQQPIKEVEPLPQEQAEQAPIAPVAEPVQEQVQQQVQTSIEPVEPQQAPVEPQPSQEQQTEPVYEKDFGMDMDTPPNHFNDLPPLDSYNDYPQDYPQQDYPQDYTPPQDYQNEPMPVVNDKNFEVYQSYNYNRAMQIYADNLSEIDIDNQNKFLEDFHDKLNTAIDSNKMVDNNRFYNHLASQVLDDLNLSDDEKKTLKDNLAKDFNIKDTEIER